MIDKIHHLIPRPAKWNKTDVINVGDVVLFTSVENAAMNKTVWKLGRGQSIPKKNKIVVTYPGNSTGLKLPKMKTITRCPRDISVISAAGEIDLNSKAYLEQIISPNTESL